MKEDLNALDLEGRAMRNVTVYINMESCQYGPSMSMKSQLPDTVIYIQCMDLLVEMHLVKLHIS